MAVWPPIETPLTEHEKNAYRYLLYEATVHIRSLCQARGAPSWNPLRWRSQYIRSRYAGSIANWLTNMARFASCDFKGFDADMFWRDYESMCKHDPWFASPVVSYRMRYEERLEKLNSETPSS